MIKRDYHHNQITILTTVSPHFYSKEGGYKFPLPFVSTPKLLGWDLLQRSGLSSPAKSGGDGGHEEEGDSMIIPPLVSGVPFVVPSRPHPIADYHRCIWCREGWGRKIVSFDVAELSRICTHKELSSLPGLITGTFSSLHGCGHEDF